MTIMDKLLVEHGRERRVSSFSSPVIASIDWSKQGKVETYSPTINDQYMVLAKVGVEFWANSETFEKARKHAERRLLQVLYDDTVALLDQAAMDVMSGDARRALEVISQIRKNLIGD
jgi:hypothetical protein